eukprot:3752955-Rhodomonas_salina.2
MRPVGCPLALFAGVRDLMDDEDALQAAHCQVRPVSLEDFNLALTVIEPSSEITLVRSNRVTSWSPSNKKRRHCMVQAQDASLSNPEILTPP